MMSTKEENCVKCFNEAGELFHLLTPENFDLIFVNDEDYKTGITLLGFVAMMFRDVVIYTFELMSNHLHMVASGKEERLKSMFESYSGLLQRHFDEDCRYVHWAEFKCKTIRISSLENLRNDIAYVNRNGFVVHPDVTPFSYEWGANRFYFNPEAKLRHSESCTEMTVREIRKYSRSRKFDMLHGLKMVDGYVTPLCFCAIEKGEAFFRDARHYYNKVSKSIESYKEVADSIGESVYYTDDDLFAVARNISKERYGGVKLSLLPGKAKIELARSLHYDYNASNKQIRRMLGLDERILMSLFLSK